MRFLISIGENAPPEDAWDTQFRTGDVTFCFSKNKAISCQVAPNGDLFAICGVARGRLQDISVFREGADIGAAALATQGSFVVLLLEGNAPEPRVTLVSDAGASIPCYYGHGPNGFALGTLSYQVAEATGLEAVDDLSVVDFILHGAVCHPYSWYEGIHAIEPGAVTRFGRSTVDVQRYWEPIEPPGFGREPHLDAGDWGDQIGSEVGDVIRNCLSGFDSCRVLFSGGEDSRNILSMIPDTVTCTPTVILEHENREYRFAKAAAALLGHDLEWVQRCPDHYVTALSERRTRVGQEYDIAHTHVYGCIDDGFDDVDVLLGGYLADYFFDTYMGNVKRHHWRSHQLGPPAPDTIYKPKLHVTSEVFRPEIMEQVKERRAAHHRYLRRIRPMTAGNWHSAWPLSQRPTFAHYRTLGQVGPQVVEPFLTNSLYRLAARIPESLRVNRVAYKHAFRDSLGIAGWFPSSEGKLTRLAPGPEVLLRSAVKVYQRFSQWRNAKHEAQQGSWSENHFYLLSRIAPQKFLDDGQEKRMRAILQRLARNPEEDCFSALPSKWCQARALQVGADMTITKS